jgi:hypothetical protein
MKKLKAKLFQAQETIKALDIRTDLLKKENEKLREQCLLLNNPLDKTLEKTTTIDKPKENKNKQLESLLVVSMIDLIRNHSSVLNKFLTDIEHGIEDTVHDKSVARQARKRAQDILVEVLVSYHQKNYPEQHQE